MRFISYKCQRFSILTILEEILFYVLKAWS